MGEVEKRVMTAGLNTPSLIPANFDDHASLEPFIVCFTRIAMPNWFDLALATKFFETKPTLEYNLNGMKASNP